MKLAKFFVYCENTGAYEPFNTLKEIRAYVYDHHHSDFCDFSCKPVFNSLGEWLYTIRVRAHPFYGYPLRVTLSRRPH